MPGSETQWIFGAAGLVGLALYMHRVRGLARQMASAASTSASAGKAGAATVAWKRTPPAKIDGYCEVRPPETKGYVLQQTMLRVRDAKESLDFFSRVLGMRLIRSFDFPEMEFSLYFLGYVDMDQAPKEDEALKKWLFQQPATLELTYNYGTDSDPDFKGYHNGNSDPRGFGHIGINVPDIHAACERFEKLGVEFVKKPMDGKMKPLAFIKSPDGYWIVSYHSFNPNRVHGAYLLPFVPFWSQLCATTFLRHTPPTGNLQPHGPCRVGKGWIHCCSSKLSSPPPPSRMGLSRCISQKRVQTKIRKSNQLSFLLPNFAPCTLRPCAGNLGEGPHPRTGGACESTREFSQSHAKRGEKVVFFRL